VSNYLAIANVTAALRQVVEDAAREAVEGADVTHVRPGGTTVKTPATGANLFLYGVTPNPALRNADLPSRRASGETVRRPQTALDLHYLISFYGDDGKLDTQRILGAVVRTLHARPTLSRTMLRDAVVANTWLADADAAEASELVRFTPVSLNLEELSKLWSVLFQTPYALSVAYVGSVVLLEAEETAAATLPVRGRNVYVVPRAQPIIESVANADGAALPILADTVLSIHGQRLAGAVTRLRIGTAGGELEPTSVSAREVRLALGPLPAGAVRAGVQGVQVIHHHLMGTPPVPHRGEASNVAAFVLRPTIRRVDDDPEAEEHQVEHVPADAPDPPRVRVAVRPRVAAGQEIELLLNPLGDDGPAYRYPGRAEADTDTPEFPVPGLTAGTYLVRVRVDGAESLLETDDAGAYARPRLEVP
jgi:hypothetical protein